MAATKLFVARTKTTPLSPLVVMSDPKRLPNIFAATARLPEGSTIIYRHYGKGDRIEEAERLRQITFDRGQQFLIGADPQLAVMIGADGVHFRRDHSVHLPNLWRSRCPDWIITMAGLKASVAYTGDLSCLDGLFISSIFKSASPSAGEPIGIKKLKQICENLPAPVIALGGIHAGNVQALIDSGVAGLAGVSGIID